MKKIRPAGALDLNPNQEEYFRQAHDALLRAAEDMAQAHSLLVRAADTNKDRNGDDIIQIRRIRHQADAIDSRRSETLTTLRQVDRLLAGDEE